MAFKSTLIVESVRWPPGVRLMFLIEIQGEVRLVVAHVGDSNEVAHKGFTLVGSRSCP